MPPEEKIAVMDHAVELEFLSGRPLHPLKWFRDRPEWRSQVPPRRLLTTPHLGKRLFLGTEGRRWLAESCEVEVRSGDYALYRVTGAYPAKLKPPIPVARNKGVE